jgi:hypothetical protein
MRDAWQYKKNLWQDEKKFGSIRRIHVRRR